MCRDGKHTHEGDTMGTQAHTQASEIRYCADIGMFAIDRPIPASCVHQTAFCKSTCFNVKLYNVYSLEGKDARNEAYWQGIDGREVAATLARKRKQTNRARFMTRGEALRDWTDFARVLDVVRADSTREWWLPTRAWRNPLMRARIEAELLNVPNLHVLASMDPSNTAEEWESLRAAGWSTMFYGDNTRTVTPLGERMFKCPKTWGKVKGACGSCKRGCFQGHGRVDVSLKQH